MTIDTKAIRAAAEAATPGPWKFVCVDGNEYSVATEYEVTSKERNHINGSPYETSNTLDLADFHSATRRRFYPTNAEAKANAMYVATANPTTVIALLDRLEAAEALRAALAEPAVHSQKDYKIVPIKPPEDALAVARRAYGNATVYDVAHVWHAIITALPNSLPQPPAEIDTVKPVSVPLLSDDEIYEMYSEPSSDAEMLAFGRAIEQAVRQNAGVK